MLEKIIQTAEELSIRAVMQAGQVARDGFDHITEIHEKDVFGDVVTEVDLQAEKIILDEIMKYFPPTLQWCMLAKGDIDGIVLH